MTEKILLNGKFFKPESAKVSIFDPGFLYGYGLFETMRACGGEVFRLDAHINRLLEGASLIGLNIGIDNQELKNQITGAIKENNLKDCYVRLTAWQGEEKVNLSVFARKYEFLQKEAYNKGFKAVISQVARQNEFSLLSRIKSSNYLALFLAYNEAKKKNADEAILLNTQGEIAEGSRSNVFIVKDNCLVTPALACGCLAGITRDTVLDICGKEKIKAVEGRISARDIYNADETFLTNSLIEIMPLVYLDGQMINKGRPGRITELIRKRYRSLVSIQ